MRIDPESRGCVSLQFGRCPGMERQCFHLEHCDEKLKSWGEWALTLDEGATEQAASGEGLGGACACRVHSKHVVDA